MNFARLATRVTVGGVAAALATAGLVGATTTMASAVPVSTTYTCATPLGAKSFPVTVDVALPPTGAAGLGIPAGLLAFKSTVTVPSDVAAALPTANGAKSDDFSAVFGTAAAKAPVNWNTPPAAPNGDGSLTFSGTGSNAAFQLPAAGTYDVTMPKQFTLIPTSNGTALPVTAVCTSATPTKIGSITLDKQNSVTKAKAAKKAAKGKPVTVGVKVANDHSKEGGVIPTGKLIIKDGKKKVGKGKLDAKGKAKIKVKGLAVGVHSLTVIYKGDDYDNGSKSKTVKVTVS